MPLQNRVTPLGELIADPARGLVYGNRGCLHDEDGRIRRRFATKRWIACRLRFRGWRRHPLMRPGGFTELFFLDEATALAAGHRPCALCRREDYVRLMAIWSELHPGPVGADPIDERLHRVLDGDVVRGEVLREQAVVTDFGGRHGRQRGPPGQGRRAACVLRHPHAPGYLR